MTGILIDYYLKKHCPLGPDKKNPRCAGCVWRDRELKRCIFALSFPRQVTVEEFIERLNNVNIFHQAHLSHPRPRFCIKKDEWEQLKDCYICKEPRNSNCFIYHSRKTSRVCDYKCPSCGGELIETKDDDPFPIKQIKK